MMRAQFFALRIWRASSTHTMAKTTPDTMLAVVAVVAAASSLAGLKPGCALTSWARSASEFPDIHCSVIRLSAARTSIARTAHVTVDGGACCAGRSTTGRPGIEGSTPRGWVGSVMAVPLIAGG